MRLIIKAGTIVVMAVTFISSCDRLETEKMYRNGVIICASPDAADVGLTILKRGGDAVDAACAAALAMAVTLPRAGNLGGGGLAMVYRADSQSVYFLDFRETAPQRAEVGWFIDSTGKVDRDKATVGPLAAGVPGTVAGLFELHRRFGRLEWAPLVQPARYLADTGFIVPEFLAQSIEEYAVQLARYQSSADIFLPEGRPIQAGRQFIQKDLAQTLGLIEEKGPGGFYEGETAQKIASFCAQNGGLITLDDLRSYVPVWREPIRVRFRDSDLYMPGSPSSGGVVVGQILSLLDGFELGRYTPTKPDYLHLYIESARRAFADREQYLGDPGFVPDYSNALLEPAYIDERRQSINPQQASPSESILPGVPVRSESSETTHLIAVDREGNIVSLTYTINLPYGSKAVVTDAGFLLNNEIDDFAIVAGEPNAFGLVGGAVNRIEPRKRMLSSMTPTIVLKEGQPRLVVGARGGSRIISAVAQTILNYCLFGRSLSEAVNSPRIHHQWFPDQVDIEPGGLEKAALQQLIDMGHVVTERVDIGSVMAAGFSDDGRFIIGAADRRTPGGTVRGY